MIKTTDTIKLTLTAGAKVDASTWTTAGLKVAAGTGATITYSGAAADVKSNTGGTLELLPEKDIAANATFTIVMPAAAAPAVTVTDGN